MVKKYEFDFKIVVIPCPPEHAEVWRKGLRAWTRRIYQPIGMDLDEQKEQSTRDHFNEITDREFYKATDEINEREHNEGDEK